METIGKFDKRNVEAEKETIKKRYSRKPGTVAIGVAGSARLEIYTTDIGWGRPTKVEIISIDKTGAIAMAESSDGKGGEEIGVALKMHEMERFASCIVCGSRKGLKTCVIGRQEVTSHERTCVIVALI